VFAWTQPEGFAANAEPVARVEQIAASPSAAMPQIAIAWLTAGAAPVALPGRSVQLRFMRRGGGWILVVSPLVALIAAAYLH